MDLSDRTGHHPNLSPTPVTRVVSEYLCTGTRSLGSTTSATVPVSPFSRGRRPSS